MIMQDNQESLPIVFEDATDENVRSRILTFYKEHPEMTLKTLVCCAYRQSQKEYIAVVIRGDLTVDFDKLKNGLGLSKIRLASKDEMATLGLVTGYVSPIDCTNMKVIGDVSITKYCNYYDGGNRDLLYRKNVNYSRDFTVWKMMDISR